MTIYLKQSTASQEVLLGPFVDDTDGKTAETALSIANTDIKLWLAGATTLANKTSGGATHISAGNYYAVLDATDTATLGSGRIIVQMTGALPVFMDFCVLAANVYDSLIGGGDILDVSTTQFNGSAVTQSGGRPEVNTSHFAGTAITAAAGIPEVKVASIAANAITATAIASDAITAAKVADDVSTEIRTKVMALTTCSGTVGTGSTTANVVASAVAVGATTSLSADAWKGRVIIFNSDTTTAALRGQAATIVSHTSGTTPTFTLATGAWTTAPLTTDTFTVV